MQVFNEGEFHRFAVAHFADNNGNLGETRHSRRAPSSFAGNELIAAVREGANKERLNHAVGRDAVRELFESFFVKAFSRLFAVRLNVVELQLDRALRGFFH